jgi:uncharacterized protein YgiM (DUF1202 family)
MASVLQGGVRRCAITRAAFWWLALAFGAPAFSAEPVVVEVADPYLELRTGTGDVFPVFYIAERGERVEILMRRTDWFKVRTERGKEGWVSREQMERTLTQAGVRTTFRDVLLDDYLRRRFFGGVDYGYMETFPMLSVRLGYQLSRNFGIEVARAQAVGTFSTIDMTSLNLSASPVTDSRFVPYLSLGVGKFRKTPKVTLVNARTLDATIGNAGVGMQVYLTRNFTVRADYRQFIAPIDENRLDKYNQWSLGIGAFF